ncbi:MAG: recombination protein O N-terminal domain-containing protein [Acidobacteria bacterium]|nr:recombination protein O N-terminal domain-containing protein [Acidobacteriota bacterium]
MLRTFTLKEADKVCIFFTREAGKVRGVARGRAGCAAGMGRVSNHSPKSL